MVAGAVKVAEKTPFEPGATELGAKSWATPKLEVPMLSGPTFVAHGDVPRLVMVIVAVN